MPSSVMIGKGALQGLLSAVALVAASSCASSAPSHTFHADDRSLARQDQRQWIRIEVGDAFSFEAPPDTQAVRLVGVDSAVGGYRSGRFTVTFDYGAFSSSLSEETPWTVIDGHRARIEVGTGACQVLPDDRRRWRFGGAVYIELQAAPDPLGLTMTGCAADEVGLAELQRLFLSLRMRPEPTRSVSG